MKGRLTLTFNGDHIDSSYYRDQVDYNAILDRWKKRYGKGLQKAQINDDLDEDVEHDQSPWKKGDEKLTRRLNKSRPATSKRNWGS
jgi:hypothetical protein